MTDIKVPIGRGVAQFIPQQQEQKNPELLAQTEGAWLKALADQGKLRIFDGGNVGAGSETIIIPVPGETLHLISVSGVASATADLTLRSNISGAVIPIDVLQFTTEARSLSSNNARGFSIVGNGVDFIEWVYGAGGTINTNVLAYIEPSSTESSRGTTRVISI